MSISLVLLVDPDLINQTHPGNLFVHRNAKSIFTPPNQADDSQASIELSVAAPGIEQVVGFAHTDWEAMNGAIASENSCQLLSR